MSGIPHELVQRLAQELLRQDRLEAAHDATPAITLEIEEDATTQEEIGLATAIAAERAAPEGARRTAPDHPSVPPAPCPTDAPRGRNGGLLHQLRPTAINGRAGKPVDHRRGPATTSGRPSRETAQRSRLAAGGARRTARPGAEFIRARARIQAASEALDSFLLEYLQEGPELAEEYPQRMVDERAA